MDSTRIKSVRGIEEKMQGLEEGSLRWRILASAKKFKTSWVELGQALYSVWKDKLYKQWGYLTFEAYTASEIGIRRQTALKLLRSYYFLEKEEPAYLREGYTEQAEVNRVPGYEAIDVLRLARSKKELGQQDYENLKKDIFEKGRDARELRKELTSLIRQRQELEPQEAHQKRREVTLRRLLGTLKSLRQEIELAKLLPGPLSRQLTSLIKKLQKELP